MPAERIPTKNKIRTLIFSVTLFSLLLLASQAINLNHKAQRALSQILEIPERFFIQTRDLAVKISRYAVTFLLSLVASMRGCPPRKIAIWLPASCWRVKSWLLSPQQLQYSVITVEVALGITFCVVTGRL